MQRTTFSLLFYIKRTKLLRGNLAPAYCKITINGTHSEISLKRGIAPNLWDVKRNSAKGKSLEAQELNEYITSMRGQLFNHHRQLQESGKEVTAITLRNIFLGIGEKKWTLLELFKQHNENTKRLIGIDFVEASYMRYVYTVNHIIKYIHHHAAGLNAGLRAAACGTRLQLFRLTPSFGRGSLVAALHGADHDGRFAFVFQPAGGTA